MTLVLDSRPAAAATAPAPLTPSPIAWARDLPALPAAVLDLLALLGAEDVDIDELAAKLSLDMALTAKTLRLANSSFYGLRREVTSVPETITVLGLRMIKGIITAAAVTANFKPPVCEGFDFKAFWRHGVATAVAAQMIAFDSDVEPTAAFTAGLLFNIGQLVFASSFADRYEPVLALQASTGMDAREAERALLGVDHATVGARVAELWHLPEAIAQAIGRDVAEPAGRARRGLARTASAADRLMRAFALGADALSTTAASMAAAWPELGVPAPRWIDMAVAAGLQTEAICASLID